MANFFCTELSQKAGEDLIGTADNARIYVFIQCPPPWQRQIIDSPHIPAAVKADYLQLLSELQSSQITLRFGFIHHLAADNHIRVLIFRQPTGFASRYHPQEFHLSNLTEVIPLLRSCLLEHHPSILPIDIPNRHIFICTHGSYDKCCARYGNIFYRQAVEIVKNLDLHHIRIWQCTHFGGHRFAPTAIDFPQGRFYGRLTPESFRQILTQTGDIQELIKVYRGWAILPQPAQIVERELIKQFGWDWFNYQVQYQVIASTDNPQISRITLNYQNSPQIRGSYEAEVWPTIDNACSLHLSCESEATAKTSWHCQVIPPIAVTS
ncbi:MAG: hypothetical protein Fur0025_19990 [Oscillatoriaceae cyanobacterium]